MKSETLGTGTSEAEVTQISKHGIWLLIGEKEHFLSFENFPWFKDASISAIQNIEILNEHHLYWPDLDGLMHRVGNDSPEVPAKLRSQAQPRASKSSSDSPTAPTSRL